MAGKTLVREDAGATTFPNSGDPQTRRIRRRGIVVAVLLAQMATLMLLAGSNDSPTVDEPAHLAGAVGVAIDGDLGWNYEHPPLVKFVVGSALRATGIDVPRSGDGFADRQQYYFGREILYDGQNEPSDVMAVVRWTMLAFTILTGVALYLLSRELVDGWGAVIPVALFSLSPDILGHGRLLTFDVPVSGALLFTLWRIVRLRKAPTSLNAVWCGVALGLGFLTKFSMILFAPILAPILVLQIRDGLRLKGELSWRPVWVTAAVVAVTSWACVWLGYLIIDPALTFSEVLPPGAQNGGLRHALADLLPFPGAFRAGLHHILLAESSGRQAFLTGDVYTGGRLTFYPLVASMKTLVGTMILGVGGLFLTFRHRRSDIATVVVAPAMYIFILAMTSNLNIGLRHVLPSLILLLIPTALIASTRRGWWFAAAGVALSAVSSLAAYPNHLGYINEAWGGADNAAHLVTGSNVDWGQDLLRLSADLEIRGQLTVHLDYFGTADPSEHGVKHQRIDADADVADLTGPIAISVTKYNLDRDRFAVLGEPDRLVGSSIYVWD